MKLSLIASRSPVSVTSALAAASRETEGADLAEGAISPREREPAPILVERALTPRPS
jgi:hypothetical protein